MSGRSSTAAECPARQSRLGWRPTSGARSRRCFRCPLGDRHVPEACFFVSSGANVITHHAGTSWPIEVCWVPLASQEAQARSTQLRRLLIVGAQRLAQAELSARKPAGHRKEGGQTGG